LAAGFDLFMLMIFAAGSQMPSGNLSFGGKVGMD
jgi:hypothetical protein